jgi:adenosine deaminase CECR1
MKNTFLPRLTFFATVLLAGLCCSCTSRVPVKPAAPFASAEGYLERRGELLRTDSLMAFDADIRLNDRERSVNRKLIRLRENMIDDYLAEGFFPPAHDFLQSKAHIEQTKLYQLLRKMPKGGMLHLHGSAGADFTWLIEQAIRLPNCYVYWEDDQEAYIKGQLRFFRPDAVPEGFYEVSRLAESRPGFEEDMYELLVLEDELAQDSIYIWDEFDRIFQRLGGFYAYQPVFKEYNRVVIDSLLADGLQHVELRVIPRAGLYDLEHPAGYYNEDTVLTYLQELEQEVQQTHPEFSLKVIYTFLRFFPEEVVAEELEKAYYYRSKYPELVKGFDLVAEEDDGNTTLYFLDAWMKMDSLENVYGIDMPLYLHDGESNWHTVRNLYDAVMLDSRRIGHGYNLNFYPILQQLIKQKDICLEVCPISNQILGYVQDLRVHPANYLIRRGVQITINSDDPAIFGYNGLSYDYWSILLAWQLDLQSLKKLSMNSLAYSSLSEEEKEAALAHWQQAWDEFIGYADEVLQE